MRCATLGDRIDFVAAVDELWTKSDKVEREFIAECVQLRKMNKLNAYNNCRHSFVLLRMVSAQKTSVLRSGKFFENMKNKASPLLQDFLEMDKEYKDRIAKQVSTPDVLQSPGGLASSKTTANKAISAAQRRRGGTTAQQDLNLTSPSSAETRIEQADRRTAAATADRSGRHSNAASANVPQFGRAPSGNPTTTQGVSQLTAAFRSQNLTDALPTSDFRSSGRLTREGGLSAEGTDPADETETLGGLTAVIEASAEQAQGLDPELVDEDKGTRDNLKKAYKVRKSEFFNKGRVFSILWPEPLGQSQTKNTMKSVVRGPHGQDIFVHPRRMVVVQNRHGACWCVAINSYGGRGLLKTGFKAADIEAHTVIYDSTKRPMYLSAAGRPEPRSNKREIAVKMAASQLTLESASRVHLGHPYTVNHNLKVQDIGQVVEEDLQVLIAYVRAEFHL